MIWIVVTMYAAIGVLLLLEEIGRRRRAARRYRAARRAQAIAAEEAEHDREIARALERWRGLRR